MKRVITAIMLALTSGAPFAAITSLGPLEGRYEVPSKCSMLGDNGYEPCGPQVRDYFQLTVITDRTASFELSSKQTNMHSCSVSGVAELKDGSLVFVDDSPEEQGLKVTVTDTEISFSYLKPEVAGRIPSYCGTRASIGRINFPRSAKVEQ